MMVSAELLPRLMEILSEPSAVSDDDAVVEQALALLTTLEQDAATKAALVDPIVVQVPFLRARARRAACSHLPSVFTPRG